MKKLPQKVAYLGRNSVVSEIFFLLPYICPMAQMAEFMFQNIAYRATVCITGVVTLQHNLTQIKFKWGVEAEADLEGDAAVQVWMLYTNGHHEAADEHHVGLF